MVAGCIVGRSAPSQAGVYYGCTQTVDTGCAMGRKLCYNGLPNRLRCACHYADESVLLAMSVGQKNIRVVLG